MSYEDEYQIIENAFFLFSEKLYLLLHQSVEKYIGNGSSNNTNHNNNISVHDLQRVQYTPKEWEERIVHVMSTTPAAAFTLSLPLSILCGPLYPLMTQPLQHV